MSFSVTVSWTLKESTSKKYCYQIDTRLFWYPAKDHRTGALYCLGLALCTSTVWRKALRHLYMYHYLYWRRTHNMVSEVAHERWWPRHAESTSQSHHPLQDILYRPCGRTARSTDSASVLELGKCQHFKEIDMLDVDEWDVTTHNAIEVYNGWSPMATNNTGSRSSHR